MKENAGAARFTPYALAIFLVALALRALHLWQLRASPFLTARLGDAAVYDAWARGIAAGDWLGHEVFYQAPLYPYFLGALYASLGDDPLLVRGLQCVLSALACALLASAGREPVLARGGHRGRSPARDLRAVDLPGRAAPEVRARPVLHLPRALARGAPGPRAAPRPRGGARRRACGALVLSRENALVLAGGAGGLAARAAGRRAAAAPRARRASSRPGSRPRCFRSRCGTGGWGASSTSPRRSSARTSTSGTTPERPGGTSRCARTAAPRSSSARTRPSWRSEAVGRPLSPGGGLRLLDAARASTIVVSQPADWLRLMLRKLVLLVGAIELVDSEDQYADGGVLLRAARRGLRSATSACSRRSPCSASSSRWPRRRELWWLYAAVADLCGERAALLCLRALSLPARSLPRAAGRRRAGGRAGMGGDARSWREIAACAVLVLALAAVSNGVSGMSKASMGAVTHVNLANSLRARGQARARRRALPARRWRSIPSWTDAADNLAGTLRDLGRPARGDRRATSATWRRTRAIRGCTTSSPACCARRASRSARSSTTARASRSSPATPRRAASSPRPTSRAPRRSSQRGEAAAALEHYRSALEPSARRARRRCGARPGSWRPSATPRCGAPPRRWRSPSARPR